MESLTLLRLREGFMEEVIYQDSGIIVEIQGRRQKELLWW